MTCGHCQQAKPTMNGMCHACAVLLALDRSDWQTVALKARQDADKAIAALRDAQSALQYYAGMRLNHGTDVGGVARDAMSKIKELCP